MLRKVTEKMPWRVPLTCDIEAGSDWTVPWNITDMEFGKKKVAPEIAHVVAALVAARGVAQATAAAPTPTPTAQADTEPVVHATPPTDMAPSPPPSPVAAPPPPPPMPVVAAGEVYIHTVRSSMLSMKLANRIAKVITECAGRGVNPLRVADESGTVLWYDPAVRVNPTEFAVLINRRGDA
jgi:hypothetical protein